MVDARRWQWLRQTTGEKSMRGVARACGVSHTTVQRWLQYGIPSVVLFDIVIQFGEDPVRAFQAWGMMTDEQVERLDWSAVLTYVPDEVLLGAVRERMVGRHVAGKVKRA